MFRLIEQSFVHDSFVVNAFSSLSTYDDVTGHKGLVLKDWQPVFQSLIKHRGSSIFSSVFFKTQLSVSVALLLKSLCSYPEYSEYDKMFNLVRDFLELLFDNQELLKIPSSDLLVNTLIQVRPP
jgi:hypothetical protein